MNTTDNNKLIAEFMGHKIDWGFNKDSILYMPQGKGNAINNSVVIGLDKLEFHTSWDWLMPVIYRMRDHINADMGFEEYDDWRKNFKQIDPYNYTLEQCYKEVVEFIKWYNKSK
jgi:hypothetical protein